MPPRRGPAEAGLASERSRVGEDADGNGLVAAALLRGSAAAAHLLLAPLPPLIAFLLPDAGTPLHDRFLGAGEQSRSPTYKLARLAEDRPLPPVEPGPRAGTPRRPSRGTGRREPGVGNRASGTGTGIRDRASGPGSGCRDRAREPGAGRRDRVSGSGIRDRARVPGVGSRDRASGPGPGVGSGSGRRVRDRASGPGPGPDADASRAQGRDRARGASACHSVLTRKRGRARQRPEEGGAGPPRPSGARPERAGKRRTKSYAEGPAPAVYI